MKKFLFISVVIIVCGFDALAQTKINSCIKEINANQFYTSIGRFNSVGDFKYVGRRPVVIHFDANYAGPSRAMKPVLENYANQYKSKVDFYRISITNENGDAPEEIKLCENMFVWLRKLNIPNSRTEGIPTLVFIRSDGSCSTMIKGYSKEQGYDSKILSAIREISY